MVVVVMMVMVVVMVMTVVMVMMVVMVMTVVMVVVMSVRQGNGYVVRLTHRYIYYSAHSSSMYAIISYMFHP